MGFILGLCGPAQAGKDTVADYLIFKHGWSGKISFARNLKDMCMQVFSLSEEDVNTQEGKKRIFDTPKVFTRHQLGAIMFWMSRTHSSYQVSPTDHNIVKGFIGRELSSPREVLQFVGTDVCRTLITTYHVDVVREAAEKDGSWIITDVRFPNEAELISEGLEGHVVKLSRNLEDDGSVNRSHGSEVAMSQWKGYFDTLDNTTDGLDYLFNEVDDFLERNKYKCLVK
jgi:hypothetical protein